MTNIENMNKETAIIPVEGQHVCFAGRVSTLCRCLPPPAHKPPAGGLVSRLCHPVAGWQGWALSEATSSVLLAATASQWLLGSAAATHSFPKMCLWFRFVFLFDLYFGRKLKKLLSLFFLVHFSFVLFFRSVDPAAWCIAAHFYLMSSGKLEKT